MSAILVTARPAVVPVRGGATAPRGVAGARERHLRLVPDPVVPTHERPAHERPLRLTRRGRVVVAALSLLLVAGVGVLGSRAAADGPASAPVVERHVVTPGETLWGIAASVARPGQDVRDVVVELQKLNGMGDSGLVAGEELVVPAAG